MFKFHLRDRDLPSGAPLDALAGKKEPSPKSLSGAALSYRAFGASVHSILTATDIYKTRRRWSYECLS